MQINERLSWINKAELFTIYSNTLVFINFGFRLLSFRHFFSRKFCLYLCQSLRFSLCSISILLRFLWAKLAITRFPTHWDVISRHVHHPVHLIQHFCLFPSYLWALFMDFELFMMSKREFQQRYSSSQHMWYSRLLISGNVCVWKWVIWMWKNWWKNTL